jgi:acetylornithine deacetylase
MNADPLSRSPILELLQQLVSTPSVNPTLAPGEGHGEALIAARGKEWLVSHGVNSWLDAVAPGRPNLVGEVGKGKGPTLVLCAHLDTVSTEGMTISPFDPTHDGQHVYGRGSCDMKGGAAAIMSAMATLALQPPPGRVLAALVADEEYASAGAQHFIAHYKADACVVTEPSNGDLILGHKGFVWTEIKTRGRAAHGSRWDVGISAIAKMGKIIAALEEFDGLELRRRIHPLLGPASQHCSVISGGSGISTYAESCTLKVERRTVPGETTEQVLLELHAIVSSTGEEAEIQCLLDRPPLVCARDAKIVESLRGAVMSVVGTAPNEVGVAYWMDAALFAAAGIETVDYGPTGAGAHEAVEWVDVDSVVNCAAILTETALRFCDRPRTISATAFPR